MSAWESAGPQAIAGDPLRADSTATPRAAGPAEAGIDSKTRPTAKRVPKRPMSGASAAMRRKLPTLRRKRSVSTRWASDTARSRSEAGRPQRRTAASAILAAGLGFSSQ